MSDQRKNAEFQKALSRQRWKCCWCGVQMKAPKPGVRMEPTTATREHMTPKLFGGSFSKGNIRAACFKCNCERGAAMHESLRQEHQRIEVARAALTKEESRG